MTHREPQDDTTSDRSRPTAPMPAAPRALVHLFAQAVEPGASPAQVEAARVLTALWAAAVHFGGGGAYVEHCFHNSADLSVPRRILGGRKIGACGTRPGRLVAHDHARPERRRAVREIITTALAHAGATS